MLRGLNRPNRHILLSKHESSIKSFLYNGTTDENLPAPLAFSQRIVKKTGSAANLFLDVLAKLMALGMEHSI